MPCVGLYFPKPTLIMLLKCFNLSSSSPPTKENRKERLIGQRMVWTCLEIVLRGESSLQCQDISNWVHTSQQWQLNPEETLRLHQSAWVCRSSKKLPEQHQKFLGSFLSTNSWQMISKEGKASQCHSVVSEDQHQQSPMKTSKEWQGEPMPQLQPLYT